MSSEARPGGIRLRLPATSANLGPGFDAVAVALDFALQVEATPASEFSIVATGRDAERCSQLENNLIVDTYKTLLDSQQRPLVPLALRITNEIPLGMGCGSSAAARLAAIALAVHFGQLTWETGRILAEAQALEGHPDNVAACWLGGFVAARCAAGKVHAVQVEPPADWRAMVALPARPVPTSQARAVLPQTYPIDDVVANLQSVALLALAFAQGRGDLLKLAMSDRIHQPYREPICPLLPLLLPLIGEHGILGAALSGAGPAVLVVVNHEMQLEAAKNAIERSIANQMALEVITCRFSRFGITQEIEKKRVQ
jgi:homoserine kinase